LGSPKSSFGIRKEKGMCSERGRVRGSEAAGDQRRRPEKMGGRRGNVELGSLVMRLPFTPGSPVDEAEQT
jgi:hypothetical protein